MNDRSGNPVSEPASGKDAVIQALREELAITNKGMLALNLELEEKMQELGMLNEELKSFAYSISHDLRQPLRAIEGFTGMLQEDYIENFDEQGRDYMVRIRGGVARMNDMLEGLLTLSRITRKELTRREVDLGIIAQKVLAELSECNPDHKVKIHIDEGMKVFADAQLMESLIQNLLSNAWKYSTGQQAPEISFIRKQVAGEWVFAIEDNGVGFDPKYKDKLFGVFQRLHSDKEFEGMGIGLATVQRIVRRHGGRIWAESEPDQGASFMFSLPEGS